MARWRQLRPIAGRWIGTLFFADYLRPRHDFGLECSEKISDAKRLKALEDENAKLKKLLAEAGLDKAMLKEIAAKNARSPHPASPAFTDRFAVGQFGPRGRDGFQSLDSTAVVHIRL